MLSFSPLLGINLSLLGTRRSLIIPSSLRLSRAARFPLVQLTKIEPFTLHSPLLQTSKLLSAANSARLHRRAEQPDIGWDNWNPLDANIDSPFNLDSFNDNPDQASTLENRESNRLDHLDRDSDFFTTIITPELVRDNPIVDRPSGGKDGVKVPVLSKKDRLQILSPEESKSQSKSKSSAKKSSDSVKPVKSAKLDRNKSSEILPEITTQIHPQATPTDTNEIDVEKNLTESTGVLDVDINDPILTTASPLFPHPAGTPTPSTELELDPKFGSNSRSDNLHSNPLPPQTNINPPNLFSASFPSIQPVETSILSNQLEADSESEIKLRLDNPSQNLLPHPANINTPTILPTAPSPQAEKPTSSNSLDLDTKSVSELIPDNIWQDSLSTQNNINQSNSPLTEIPAVEKTTINESEYNSFSDHLPQQLISPLTNIDAPTLISTLQTEETSTQPQPEIANTTIIDSTTEFIPANFAEHPVPTNINQPIHPSTAAPFLQTQETPILFDPLAVDHESANTLLPANLFPASINPPTFPSTQIDQTPIQLDEVGTQKTTITDSASEFIPNTIQPNTLPTQITISDSIATSFPRAESIDVDNIPTEIPDNLDSIISKISTTNLKPEASKSSIIQAENLSLFTTEQEESITTPTPVKGYATGGHVKESSRVDLQSIAASDTVSAMLTPGEFVINAKDAQKNLNLLTHINSGGEPDSVEPTIAPTPQTTESLASNQTSTENLSTAIQRKSQDSLASPSLQQEIDLHQISFLNKSPLDTPKHSQIDSRDRSQNYASPSLIFRKPTVSTQSNYSGIDTPDRWNSMEELINGGDRHSDISSFNSFVDPSSSSPQQHHIDNHHPSPSISPQYTSPVLGFATGGEVAPADISREIEPIAETIEAPTSNQQGEEGNNDPAELEILAREIYYRLRQRLEIERERHGSYSGNLSW